ncbi:hypothetical protein EMIT0111MI5_30150 [Burkholderia sp. IT-111MI5]
MPTSACSARPPRSSRGSPASTGTPRSRLPCSVATTPIMPVRRSSDNRLRIPLTISKMLALFISKSARFFNPVDQETVTTS